MHYWLKSIIFFFIESMPLKFACFIFLYHLWFERGRISIILNIYKYGRTCKISSMILISVQILWFECITNTFGEMGFFVSSFSTFVSLYKLGAGGILLKSYYLHPKTCFVFNYLSHSVTTYHHHGDDPDHFVCAAVRGGAERRRSSAPRIPRQKHKSLQVFHQRHHNPHSRKRLLPLSSSPPPLHPSSPSHPPP